MKISEEYLNIITKEFRDVEKLWSETNSPEDKLYYFSATYGVINRIMNLQCESILIFVHQILQAAHQTMAQRLSAITPSGAVSSSVPTVMLESLILYLPELRIAFEKRDDNKIREALEKYNNLSYATGGNGFYLYLRGKLTI
jgi:translation initiation factor RLI1